MIYDCNPFNQIPSLTSCRGQTVFLQSSGLNLFHLRWHSRTWCSQQRPHHPHYLRPRFGRCTCRGRDPATEACSPIPPGWSCQCRWTSGWRWPDRQPSPRRICTVLRSTPVDSVENWPFWLDHRLTIQLTSQQIWMVNWPVRLIASSVSNEMISWECLLIILPWNINV